MTVLRSDADLRGHLDQWVAEGLIDADQAARIEAAEHARSEHAGPEQARAELAPPGTERPAPIAPPARPSRASLVVEALGYAGAILAVIAGFLIVRELWPSVPTSAELAFAAAASVALGIAGATLLGRSDPAMQRLQQVLWLLCTATVAAFTGVLAAQVWRFGPASVALVAAAAATACGAAFWLRTRAALQHVALFASTAVLTGTAIYRMAPSTGSWGPGRGVWVLAILWALAVTRGYLPPRVAGQFVAGVGVLVGAQLTMQVAAGHVLAAATVAGLLVGGVLLRQVWLVVLGTVGVLIVVPQTATRYLPQSVGAPLAIFVTGLVLVAAAVWLARRRRQPR